jgi:hypothetical protein
MAGPAPSPPRQPPLHHHQRRRRRGPIGRLRRGLGLAALLALAACNSERAAVTPGADLSRVKSIYVVRFAPDSRGINRLLADQLAVMGFAASTGEGDQQPRDVDAVLTYRDQWRWEVTMYMVQLDVTLTTAATHLPLASASSHHPARSRESAADMVEEVLGNIIAKNPRRPG